MVLSVYLAIAVIGSVTGPIRWSTAHQYDWQHPLDTASRYLGDLDFPNGSLAKYFGSSNSSNVNLLRFADFWDILLNEQKYSLLHYNWHREMSWRADWWYSRRTAGHRRNCCCFWWLGWCSDSSTCSQWMSSSCRYSSVASRHLTLDRFCWAEIQSSAPQS